MRLRGCAPVAFTRHICEAMYLLVGEHGEGCKGVSQGDLACLGFVDELVDALLHAAHFALEPGEQEVRARDLARKETGSNACLVENSSKTCKRPASSARLHSAAWE